MIGFAIGIACLWGLFRVLRGGRRYGWGGYGGRCGHRGGGWGGPSWRRHRRGGWDHSDDGPVWFLHGLFERLRTTPAQERVIKTAVEDVVDAARGFKDKVGASRNDVAQAFRSESFDENVMAELLTRHDDAIDEVRKSIVGSLAKIHESLDPDQRAELARWLERRARWDGPYRSYV